MIRMKTTKASKTFGLTTAARAVKLYTEVDMLALTRRIGQRVMIDDGAVKVQVLGIKGGQVLLGFEADRSIPVNREEVHEAMVRDGKIKSLPIHTK